MNLVGSWLGCREGVEGMVSQGGPAGIINVFSPHEDLPVPTDAPYRAAGAAGVRMLTRTMTVEEERATLATYLTPAFALFYRVILLGESLSIAAVLGLVLIIAGAEIASRGASDRRSWAI